MCLMRYASKVILNYTTNQTVTKLCLRKEKVTMAKLEITVSHKGSGWPVAQETFEISPELAQKLISKMEAMLAELPGRHRTTRTVRPDGVSVVEIELNRDAPPPTEGAAPLRVHPNFEELFRHRKNDDPC